MTKCFLIGAGASYGHSQHSKSTLLPPLGMYLFVDGWKSNLLQKNTFSDLYAAVKDYNDISEPIEDGDKLKLDAEKFLMRWDDIFTNSPLSEEYAISKAQRVLSQAYYFLYELFRDYTVRYEPKNDNYTALAKYANSNNCPVLSLNYDAMFEKAVKEIREDYYYSGLGRNFRTGKHKKASIQLAKLHGSITWVNRRGLRHYLYNNGEPRSEEFKERIQSVQGNSSKTTTDYQDLDDLKSRDYLSLMFDCEPPYEPAIIPPLEEHKDYNKLNVYNKVWSVAEHHLSKSSELVVIGSKLNEADKKLLDTIEAQLNSGSTITIVSGDSSEKICKRLRSQFQGINVETNCLQFTEYMKSL